MSTTCPRLRAEGIVTETSEEQADCERECSEWLVASPRSGSRAPAVGGYGGEDEADDAVEVGALDGSYAPPRELLRSQHVGYALKGLSVLPGAFCSLDASRTWIIYWCLHSLDLLGERPEHLFSAVVDFLRRCQNPSGGFGGGPGQSSHAAATYAAVLALLVIGTPEALSVIDRASLLAFFRSIKDSQSGGFHVTVDGEVDVRGCYTVLAVADLLGLLTPDLTHRAAEYLLSCQTFEGGFGGEPGNEAHGGYAFCAVAGLHILGALPRADLPALSRWLCCRQMSYEGGFQGRCNKLVDSCYSFWQGAVFPILASLGAGTALGAEASSPSPSGAASPSQPGWATQAEGLLLNREALERYILNCCQQADGGLRDKPGKSRDFYHTCYALSGLAVARWGKDCSGPLAAPVAAGNLSAASTGVPAPTHPVYNLRFERVAAAKAHFATA